jgi:histidine ammonia-lyase
MAKLLSKNILHVDVSTGEPWMKEVVRAGILVRINMLLKGHSACRLQTLHYLNRFLNEDITPIVGRYGTIGASG